MRFDWFWELFEDSIKIWKNDKLKIDEIMKLFSEIGIDTSADLVKNYLNYKNSLFCYGTKVLENTEYDSYLKERVGTNYNGNCHIEPQNITIHLNHSMSIVMIKVQRWL